MSERGVFIGFALAFVAVIAAGSSALYAPSAAVPVLQLEDLPILPREPWVLDPEPAACESSGGEVRYERSSSCGYYAGPSVYDACGQYGVPCFTGRPYADQCVEGRRPYCACEADKECPGGYACQYGRCAVKPDARR
jgi:hypothetical protein